MLCATNPVNGLGTREGEFFGMNAQPFSDGIRPDVDCDVFEGVAGAENVVVEAFFPEADAGLSAEFEGGARFENADEFQQVGTVARTLN